MGSAVWQVLVAAFVLKRSLARPVSLRWRQYRHVCRHRTAEGGRARRPASSDRRSTVSDCCFAQLLHARPGYVWVCANGYTSNTNRCVMSKMLVGWLRAAIVRAAEGPSAANSRLRANAPLATSFKRDVVYLRPAE